MEGKGNETKKEGNKYKAVRDQAGQDPKKNGADFKVARCFWRSCVNRHIEEQPAGWVTSRKGKKFISQPSPVSRLSWLE